MLANWKRLDPSRPPARIAESLLVLAGVRRFDQVPSEIQVAFRWIEERLEENPLVRPLRKLANEFRKANWPAVFAKYKSILRLDKQSSAGIDERITEILWKKFVRANLYDELSRLSRYAPAPKLDPNWNRARALLAEDPENPILNDVEDAWNAFIEDLRHVDELSGADRQTAIALVYWRLAQCFTKSSEEAGYAFYAMEDDTNIERLQQQACHYFRQSQRHDASLRDVYREHAILLVEMDQQEKAIRIYKQLCHRFPDDFSGHVTLARGYLTQEDFDEAKALLTIALKLRPRDPEANAQMWRAHIGVAREAAKLKQFGVARAELDLAAELPQDPRDGYLLDSHRAAVEYKA